METKHTCTALILHCMDFRLGKPIKEYLQERGLLGDCDIVSIAARRRILQDLRSPPTGSLRFARSVPP
jgi:hypothetical protein